MSFTMKMVILFAIIIGLASFAMQEVPGMMEFRAKNLEVHGGLR